MAVVALGLAAYSAAASYESVSRLAKRLSVPLWQLTPLGIDGGLFGVIAFDIVLTLAGRPIWWLRWTGRLFAAGVIAANAAAGWPDPVSVGLRCGAPLLFVVIVEAARTVMLGRAGSLSRDRIPRIRWLLAPAGTWSLWRRMQLWGERSFTRAVGLELDRVSAIERLSAHYAPGLWEVRAPQDLVWMLRSGVRIGEALERVSELLAFAARDAEVKAAWHAEREAMRGEIETLTAAVAAANDARTESESRLTEAGEEITRLNRKIAAGGTNRRRGDAANKGGDPQRTNGKPPALTDAQALAKAREIFATQPGITGKDLGELVGRSGRWGQLRVSEFKGAQAGAPVTNGRVNP
jgi:hypothetical protein